MTPIKDKIDGKLGGTAVFRWNVSRIRTEMIITSLNLNRGSMRNLNTILFTGTGKSPSPADGKNLARLNATISGNVNQDMNVIYQLTLENLQFSDANSAFFLRGVFESNVSEERAGASITLVTVYGSYLFFIFFRFACLFS